MQLAHADCRPTGEPGVLVLPLSPVHVAVPKNAPVGALLGSAHAAIVHDVPFTCSGSDNARELRVRAPLDTAAGLGNVYATNVPGIGFRIVTRGGSFAGIDDGPRNAAYRVKLPPHAERLTGFAVDIDFVKTGEGQGGVLAPGKLASLSLGGTEFVDVAVPDGGVVFDAMQCAPVTVGGEMSAGAGTMGAFTQEAVVISTGCAASGVSVAIGVEQGYVYGSHPSLSVDAAPKHAAHDASGFAALGSAHAVGSAGVTVTGNRSNTRRSLLDDGGSDTSESASALGSTSGGWSSSGLGSGSGMSSGMGGGMRH
ncbi:hypothetical protein [Paraburkholderia sp. J67]|uniref:hypothetical protein n=1 Tax=Paraburkholderia sp. J67 TaxID=2805435 RepID=UPI002ABE1C13|nr:hypothetical protein [Paraburkholderia sp. J67]